MLVVKRMPVQITAESHRILRLVQRRMEDDAGPPGTSNPNYTLSKIVELLIEREAKSLGITT